MQRIPNESPVESRTWEPIESTFVPESVQVAIKTILAQDGRSKKAAAVKFADGTCYMGFKQNGQMYFGIAI